MDTYLSLAPLLMSVTFTLFWLTSGHSPLGTVGQLSLTDAINCFVNIFTRHNNHLTEMLLKEVN